MHKYYTKSVKLDLQNVLYKGKNLPNELTPL